MRNKKRVWDKITEGMADRGYSRSAQQRRVKVNNLKQKYRKIGDKITKYLVNSDKNGRCLN